ncbi:MAG: Fe-S cluster assembly protein SufD [Alphaproteobacteria bacterium]|nr:Fe-S cluster assembly protein SufD [Alphaproteobacteria bacterium]
MSGLLQQISLPGGQIPWLDEMRRRGRAAFEAAGIPTAKTEAWKYTKPRELGGDDFVLSLPRPDLRAPQPELPFAAYRIYFENGIFNPAQSVLPQGVEVLPLIEVIMFRPRERALINAALRLEDFPFAALNSAYLNEGVFIHVDSRVELKRPLAVIYHTDSAEQNLFYNLRNLILLEEYAAAELIEYHCYDGALKSRYLANIVNEVYLRRGACLRHYKVQNEAFKANHIALNYVDAAAGAAYKAFCLQKGANIARNETHVLLKEEGASAEVNGAYLMNGWATLDTTTDIEHLAPCTVSHQLVKGVIGGDAKGVFQGRIHIAPGAVRTEGNQLHKALLLSDTAEVDVKPELEIFADDVKCSHGAASGELDEEQLFYMRSRGIGEEEARRLLIDAYLDDAISKIEDEKVAAWIKLMAK